MKHAYTYAGALAASERINWRVEDLIGGDKRLDFTRPFLPESLARVAPLTFLEAAEKRTLNQIRGLGYLYMFGLVEEFILPFVLDHARSHLRGRRLPGARLPGVRRARRPSTSSSSSASARSSRRASARRAR